MYHAKDMFAALLGETFIGACHIMRGSATKNKRLRLTGYSHLLLGTGVFGIGQEDVTSHLYILLHQTYLKSKRMVVAGYGLLPHALTGRKKRTNIYFGCPPLLTHDYLVEACVLCIKFRDFAKHCVPAQIADLRGIAKLVVRQIINMETAF